jgi:uncharacterized protein DUF5683
MRMLFIFLLVLTIQPFAFTQQTDPVTKPRDSLKLGDTLHMGGERDTTGPVIVTGDKIIDASGKDSLPPKKDSVPKHSPRKASLRSAILPGWGQIYNKKYWKLPLVYAAIGIPGYLIYDNKRWYDRSRYALAVAASDPPSADSLAKVHPELRALTQARSINAIRNYRNEFRKNMDYSILITLLFWGLNVIDATVDAHLKDFDVSDEITMKIKPVIMTGTRTPGLSFVFSLNNKDPHRTVKPVY